MTAEESEAWRALAEELSAVIEQTDLDNIEPFRIWGQRVARFSFLLSPFAGDEPEGDTTTKTPGSQA